MAKVSLRAYNREIETMIDRGQLDEAIAHCQHILKTFPKHLETYRLLGKSFLEYKRYKDAVDIFSRVLVVEPNDFVANVGMSIIRDEEDKLDDAIWHMERAFEVQPSNAAIQGELQRLYGRREGVQPSRIRMTRGALAHMYVQGELYPQAISEIKSVLADDAGRTDMQVLMARAHYRSGQKTEAADTASSVLRRYPYCLDANRILVEILGVDRAENAQVYRHRVIELDPYAAQVSGSIFQADEVGDAAVTLEHLEWGGQPVGMQSDWESAQAIRLESETGRGAQAQPDWLKSGGFPDSTPPPLTGTPRVVPPLPTAAPTFDIPAPSFSASEAAQPTPEADIPDFLRAAGWEQSTGEFDESKSMFADEPATSASALDALPIEQGDMPDWVKAMAPPQVSQPAQPTGEEELPDWINRIGTGVLSASAASTSSDELDWLNPTDEPSETQAPASDDQPDWMKQFDQPASSQPAATDQPDWMKQFDQPASESPVSSDQPDWLKGFGNEPEPTPASTSADQPDWMNEFGSQPEEPTPATLGNEFDFLEELTTAPASQSAEPTPSTVDAGNLGVSEQERDDSFAWLESLAAKQGASEGLLTKPEERMEEEPEWVKQAKGMSAPVAEQPPVSLPTAQPVVNIEDLGKSDQERDDSFAWLENLAAKQGATEGLLTTPEERLEVEPEWIQQAKSPSQVPPEPIVNVEDLGKSDQERDDSFAWLENLAAKQGATEGLLTKPEDRLEVEPEWVQQAKKSTGELHPQPTTSSPEIQPVANIEELGKSDQERDDSFAWLENLAAKQGATEGLLTKPEDRLEVEPEWVQQAKSVPQVPAEPVVNVEDLGKSDQERDDSFAWLENLAAKQGATEGLLTKPEDRLEAEPEWVRQAKKGTGELQSQPPSQQQEIQPATNIEDLGKSDQERDDSFAWLENLAAKQGATEGLLTKPEDRLEVEPEWVQQAKSTPQPLDQAQGKPPTQPESFDQESGSVDETAAWLRSLDEEESKPEPVSANDETAMWLQNLDEPESVPVPQAAPADDMPAWLQGIEEEQAAVAESVVPASEPTTESDWMNAIEEQVTVPAPVSDDDNLPSWLKGMDEDAKLSASLPQDDLPAWMRDETGEVMAEPTKIEPTRPTDWQPVEEKQPEPPVPQPIVHEEPRLEPAAPVQEKRKPVKKSAPKPAEVKPATPPEPYREPVTRSRGSGMVEMSIDPLLGSARSELSRSNIPGALETYAKLIKKGRFLDEVIFDLREALYRYPVEVSIWQSLGDAYMRANRLQDALDAYTKAEELLR